MTDREKIIETINGVLGHLTAEEVFKRFKYCWEHQTSVYKEEKDDE